MRYSRRQVSGLLLTGMALTSCSGLPLGSSSSSSTSTNSMSLNLGQISNSINFFPFYVATQQNYFKSAGLTVSPPTLLGTGAKVGAALEAGSIDIGGGVITDVFDLARIDSTAKIIGSLVNGYYVDVVVSNAFETQTNLNESSPLADKIKALKGKKVGITGPGSGTEALMIYLFRQQGLNTKTDVTLVNLGSTNTAALAALRAGRVDALSFFSPIGQAAEAQGIGKIFISPDRGDVPALAGDVHGVFYTKQSVIDAKPKAVQAFISAVSKAETYIQSQPAESKVLLNKYLKLGTNVTSAVYSAISPVWAKTPTISTSGYSTAAKFHVAAGLISIAPTYSNLVATSTINAALSSSK